MTKDKIHDNFLILLDSFREVNELYQYLDVYNKNNEKIIYHLNNETISQICCQYLSSNIIHYFKTQEKTIKGLK